MRVVTPVSKPPTGHKPVKLLPVKILDNPPVIKAHYDSAKEWRMDAKGFFTIKPFPKEGLIRVRYYNAKREMQCLIEGKTAEDIYNTIVREGMVSLLSHAAYIGAELMKAEVAMKLNLPFEQDCPLEFPRWK